MSTKKPQRISGVPAIPLTQTGFRNVDKMDEVYGDSNYAPRERDPMDEMDRELQRDKVEEYRKLREQRRNIEFQKRIETEKKELKQIEMGQDDDGTWSAKNPNLSAQDLLQVSKPPPEEQKGARDYAMDR